MNIKEILEGKRIVKVKSKDFDFELKLYLDDGSIFTIYPMMATIGYKSMKIVGNILGHDIAVNNKLKEDEWKLE